MTPALRVAVAAVVVAALAGCGGSGGPSGLADDVISYGTVPDRAGFRRDPPLRVADVVLTDHAEVPSGRPFRMVAPEGGLLVVFFGYLSCPDVCPTTLGDVSRAVSLLPAGASRRVEVAMVTVDPERDEGPEVARYLRVFLDRGIHALRPADEGRLVAAARSFEVLWEVEDHPPGATDYAVGHTATVYVVDDRGEVVWQFPFGTAADAMAAALVELLG